MITRRPRKRKSDLPWQLLFLALAMVLIYPIIFAVSSSFKTLPEVYSNSLGIIPREPTAAAYTWVVSRMPFFRIIFNTFTVASIVTLFKLFSSVLAAYSFAFLKYKGKRLVYFILICTIFIPFTVTMILHHFYPVHRHNDTQLYHNSQAGAPGYAFGRRAAAAC